MAEKKEKQYVSDNAQLIAEWNWEKNTELGFDPHKLTCGSNKKVWWVCKKGHEWQSTINNRTSGRGCPICSSEQNTSFPEYALFFYLQKYGLHPIHSYKNQGYELDIYIPSKKVAIEYDGHVWHKSKTNVDLEKNRKCENDGIKLYRIREELPVLNDSSIDYVVRKYRKDLAKILAEVLCEIAETKVDVDLERDSIAIENLREHTEKENSILLSNPEIAREWNHKKNGRLKPENFAANSGKKAWWICQNGHEWKATIHSRNIGIGCPYCSGKKAIKGYNDLQTINPVLANEWNYEKNDGLTPADVLPNSNKKVWWICKQGHEWQVTVADRNNGSQCPYCSGRFAIKGENDLQTINPILANEWDYHKNDGLTPADVLSNSNKKVWWICTQGHEWQATISNRNGGTGCPYCSGRYVVKGKNDLQTANPTLAKEWNYERNGGLSPADISPNSNKKVWWKCIKGHEWEATIGNRNRLSRGCPYCSGRYAIKGQTDLQTTNPTLAREWNLEKNHGLTPADILPNSNKKVWWKCIEGHEWEATVNHRNNGRGCPICAKKRKINEQD